MRAVLVAFAFQSAVCGLDVAKFLERARSVGVVPIEEVESFIETARKS